MTIKEICENYGVDYPARLFIDVKRKIVCGFDYDCEQNEIVPMKFETDIEKIIKKHPQVIRLFCDPLYDGAILGYIEGQECCNLVYSEMKCYELLSANTGVTLEEAEDEICYNRSYFYGYDMPYLIY